MQKSSKYNKIKQPTSKGSEQEQEKHQDLSNTAASATRTVTVLSSSAPTMMINARPTLEILGRQ